MNTKKLAAEDAAKWARAEMFFGEGAGTRRKLLSADIESKMAGLPGYRAAFSAAYDKQDFSEHAIKAAKERQRIDRTRKMDKNARAIIRGDKRHMSPITLALVTLGGLALREAYNAGYDKVVYAAAKKQYQAGKQKLRNIKTKLAKRVKKEQ